MKQPRSHMQKIKNNAGAMFGMDARVALVIASVLAATGSISIMSKLERSRVQKAEYGVQQFIRGLETYYSTVDTKKIPREYEELFETGAIEDSSLKEDPWNARWSYSTVSKEVMIQNVPVNVHYAVIFSAGKDGLSNSEDVTTPAEWDSWAPKGDDIGIKFSTLEIDKARVENYVDQARIIVAKLEEFEQTRYVEVDTTCTTTPDNPVCSVQAQDGTIIPYTNYNFYPQSSLDTTENVAYYSSLFEKEPVFISENLNSMEQLMQLLKLPAYFAQNPWGEVLSYHSNIYEHAKTPYRATIWLEQ